MIKLLVIADDFTGALDTGVQFRAKGTVIRLLSEKKSPFSQLPENTNVLIVDAETRHLPAEDAAKIVGQITSEAVKNGVYTIYKKTDSALRGNIGAELAAVLSASGGTRLHFVPAYPQMGRTTHEGIHYIEGVPVAQSVFGKDPFEPVRYSSVAQIIHSQRDVQVISSDWESCPAPGIVLHNSQNQEDLRRIAKELNQKDQLHLLAGCAGFASVLPDILGLEKEEDLLPGFTPKLLTICGSINPITLQQLDAAEDEGVPRIRLNVRQKLDAAWLETWDADAAISGWAALAQSHDSIIIECDGLGEPQMLEAMRRQLGLDMDQMRRRISETMGEILKRLLDRGLKATLLVTGGDTLMAFMEKICQDELVPICEIASGVVLSQVRYRGETYNLLSKSGGFGARSLLSDLEMLLVKKERTVC